MGHPVYTDTVFYIHFVTSQCRALNKMFIISRYILFEPYPRYSSHYSDWAKDWTILGSNSSRLRDSSLLQNRPDRFWNQSSLLLNVYRGLFNQELTIHLHLVKGKVVPFQARSGPEGSRKLRLPDFVTTAQDGGKVVSLTHRPPLPPGNTPGTHFR